MNEFLKKLREWNDACREARDAIPTAAEVRDAAKPAAERSGVTPEEDTEFRSLAVHVAENDERIAEIELQLAAEARSGQVAQALGLPGIQIKSEPLTYTKRNADLEGVSWIRDQYRMTQGDPASRVRLERHGAEMDVEVPRREEMRARRAESEHRSAGWENPLEKRTNPNRTDGTGGYLVPPVWLMDELIPILRSGRVVADQCRQMTLPDGTDSINIPKLSTGTTAAIQTADAASVSSTDFTDTSVSVGVKTIAGQQDVSIQLIDQSPLNVDELVFTDLIADYNKKLDLQVLAGSNASGQVQGLYSSAGASSWTGYSSSAYTDASPTAGEFFPVFAQLASKMSQARFSTDSLKYFLHPRRWYWLAAGQDSTNRPLIVPSSMGPWNPVATSDNQAQGFVGNTVIGPPVFIDANITTTDTAGSGSAQDIAIALNTDDAFLFEGALRQRTLPEVLSGTLQVRIQIWNYVAFLLRYGEALAIGSGTGFSAPSGF